MKRPHPIRWLWYAAGGRLPERHREWVLRDVAGRGWAWRHFARSTVLVGPLAAVWWLLPASTGLHAALSLLALIVGYFYSGAYMVESAQHRLAKHGFPSGTFAATRVEVNRERIDRETAIYEANYRAGSDAQTVKNDLPFARPTSSASIQPRLANR